MTPYLVLYRPGPAWQTDKTIYEQDLEGHGLHLQAELEAETLLFGGPFTDSSGGFAVFVAESLEAMESRVAADPSIVSGVFVAQVRPLHMVFNKYVNKGLTDGGPGV